MEEEGETRRRREHDDDVGGGGVGEAAKITSVATDAEWEVEMEEDAVAEVMKWLQDEEEMDPAALPHSPSSPRYRQETSFVTINGNEESCGPAFSSSASTVMASVDTSGGVCRVPYFVGWPSGRSTVWPSVEQPIQTLADRSEPAPMAGVADGCGADAEEPRRRRWSGWREFSAWAEQR